MLKFNKAIKKKAPEKMEINFSPIFGSEKNILGRIFFLKRSGRLEDFLLHYQQRYSLNDFNSSIEKTKKDILYYQKVLKNRLGYNAKLIFDSYQLILNDEQFVGKINALIDKKVNPPNAVVKVAKQFISVFYNSNFLELKEKITEVRDLAIHLLFNLKKEKSQDPIKSKIVIVDSMLPSDILRVSLYDIKAIVSLKKNGTTTHARTILKSLKLPYVEIDEENGTFINEEDKVYLDFNSNKLFVNPQGCFISNLKKKLTKSKFKIKTDEVKTQDQVKINIYITTNFSDEINHALVPVVKGVGLFRTEFLFLISNSYLSQSSQISIYKNVLKKMKSKAIYIRLLDLGGDKGLHLNSGSDKIFKMNLGDDVSIRGIRRMLNDSHLLMTQLQALFIANKMVNKKKPLNVIVPFVSSVDELMHVRSIINRVLEDLHYKEKDSIYRLGIMIEIPSVIWNLSAINEQVDFFSIGSNDIVSHLLAVRNDYSLKDSDYIYNPIFYRYMHKLVSELKSFEEKEIILCGELGEKVEFLEFLIGIGIKHLSINVGSLEKVVRKINSLSFVKSREKAKIILEKKSIQEVKESLLNVH